MYNAAMLGRGYDPTMYEGQMCMSVARRSNQGALNRFISFCIPLLLPALGKRGFHDDAHFGSIFSFMTIWTSHWLQNLSICPNLPSIRPNLRHHPYQINATSGQLVPSIRRERRQQRGCHEEH
jgi:hypothetical protein